VKKLDGNFAVGLERIIPKYIYFIVARTNRCYNERGSRTNYVRSSTPHCIWHLPGEFPVSAVHVTALVSCRNTDHRRSPTYAISSYATSVHLKLRKFKLRNFRLTQFKKKL